MDEVEKDKIILSAEKIGKQKKKVMRGLPRVANDTKTMSKGSRGNVVGYFSKSFLYFELLICSGCSCSRSTSKRSRS